MPTGLSVVVAVHNEERTVGNLLTKLLSQSAGRDVSEIILVSSGSTDRTNAEIGSFRSPLVTLIEEDDRRGKVNALKKALPYISGGHVLLLDADVDIDDDLLKTCFRCILRNHVPCTARIVSVEQTGGRLFHSLANMTFKTWNALRERKDRNGEFLYPSGHGLLLSEGDFRDALGRMEDATINDDALFAFLLFQRGVTFRYNRDLIVRVGFPQTFRDFFRQKVRTRMGRRQVYAHFFAEIERQWRVELVASLGFGNLFPVLLLWVLDSVSRGIASIRIKRCAQPHLWPAVHSSKNFLGTLLLCRLWTSA